MSSRYNVIHAIEVTSDINIEPELPNNIFEQMIHCIFIYTNLLWQETSHIAKNIRKDQRLTQRDQRSTDH